MSERIDTVVVGGGQAGLAMSHHLPRIAREHVVIERGQVAQSWRSERWDSLMFQFPSLVDPAARVQLRDRRTRRLCSEG